MLYSNKNARRIFLIYTAINVFAYALAHVEYLFYNDTLGEIFAYLGYYVSRSVEFIALPVIATLSTLAFIDGGLKRAVIAALKLSCARLFYTLPYYYIVFVQNYRYDSIESVLLSLCASILIVILTTLGALCCLGVAISVLRKKGIKTAEELREITEKPTTLSFLDNASLSILIFTLMRFAFSLVSEIVDTVLFFVEYGADYTCGEIFTILINYVFLFVLLIASYAVCMLIKNAIVKRSNADITKN